MKKQIVNCAVLTSCITTPILRKTLMRWNSLLSLLAVAALVAGPPRGHAAGLLAPGQPIIGVAATPASSTSSIATVGTTGGVNNYPAAESPANAIDGSTNTKYLNFAEINTGFIVTIPGGLTYLNGFQFTTANDAPERDPIMVTLQGTSAPDPTTAAGGATWTTLYSGVSGLAAATGRYTNGLEVNFANSAGFNTYRMLITDVRSQPTANSMQFSEIQFLGTSSPDTNGPVIVNLSPAPGTVGGLSNITVNFDEAVSGVDATDLLINGTPATSMSGSSASYTFRFTQPPLGPVQISFASDHGIQDFANPPNELDETGTNANWQYNLIDNTPPTVVARSPLPSTTVSELNAIQVDFSEPVSGVDAADLLINGVPATNLLSLSPTVYTWEFPQPATGVVTIAFAPGHGIADLALSPNAFGGLTWSNIFNPNFQYTDFIITEFLASNSGDGPNPLRDEDGDTSDWIEIYNPDTTVGDIGGFFITDAANNPTKWRFPIGTTVPARGYLVIFASGKNRTNVMGRLHSNFNLNNNGEYLGLFDPKTNVVSEYFPTYPSQSDDVSYGRDRNTPSIVGYYATPTPGAHNLVSGDGFGPDVQFSRSGGTFVGTFHLALSVNEPGSVIRYTIVNTAQDVGNATNIPTATSPLYTGPIAITNTMQVRARAFPTNASIFPGAPRTECYVQLGAGVTNFTSPLPIIVIHTLAGTSFSGGYPALDNSIIVQAFDNTNGQARLTDTPQLSKRAGINLRGSSTQGYPKSSYAVEFWDEFNTDEEAPLLGLPKESDWVLYAPNRFDQVRIHNPIYHTIGNMIGRYSSRTRFVEVFVRNGAGPINANMGATGASMGDYWGVYVLEEKVKRDGNRVDIDELKPEQTNSPAITGGYLLKVDRTDGNERNITAGGQTMVYQDPDGLEMVTPARALQANYLANYLNLFNATLQGANLTNGTGTNHYSFYFDVDAGIDHNILGTITLNADAMRLSGYLYKPRGGKITYGPIWDVDRGLGTGLASADQDWRAYNPRCWTATNPLGLGGGDYGTDFFNANNVYGNVWYARLFNDPDFWQKWIDRWQELRATVWTSNALFAVVDNLGAQVAPIEARDTARWGGNGGSDVRPRNGTISSPNGDYSHNFPGTYQGELDFQKKWLGDRIHFIDTNFLARPRFNVTPGQVPSGTVLTLTDVSGKPGTKIYYTLDGTDPRASQNRTNASAIEYTGPITITNNVRVIARAINSNHRNLTGNQPPAGVNHLNPPISSIWSGPLAETFFTVVPPLIVTELMFNPAPPVSETDTNDADNFEFIELKNIGASTLNLAGFRFTNGIDFQFSSSNGATTIAPGGFIVVAKDTNAFAARYGALANVAGPYHGNLDNAGERITLVGAALEPVLDFTYSDEWFNLTDGVGFSLVAVNDSAPSNLSTNTSWRVSSQDGGSPGAVNPAAVIINDVVVVNEVLSHTDPPTLDTIELLNAGTNTVDLSGWWLSDDFNTPKKFQIPNGVVLAPGQFATFDESQFNAGGTGFAISSDGDEVYLFSGANGFITGYYQGTDFGAAQNGRTFGRYTNSQGAVHFVAQATNTLGTNNSLPIVGPVVISEIMYHPPEISFEDNLLDNTFDEYVELLNISATNVPLYHTQFPANTWRLSGGVDFLFPTNIVLPPGGRVVVVSFSPTIGTDALFRARYGLSAEVPIYGPYSGKLDNSAERVRLGRPDAPNGRDVPYIAVDTVDYTDLTPWPEPADGLGASLHRVVLPGYGNDPTNWFAARATPGSGIEGGALATIDQQPVGLTIIEGNTATLSVAVSSATPVSYQWYHNTNVVPGATGAVLVIENILAAQTGFYSVGVFNGGGVRFSDSVLVNVRPVAVITQQPSSQNVQPNTNVTISVVATGTGTLRYQWQFEGVNIDGATNASYSFTNATMANHGNYRVLITDDVGTAISANAFIYVLVRPGFLLNPVPVTVLAGGTARFTAIATGAPPIGYRWLRQGTAILTNDTGVLVLTNVVTGGNIRVLATNLASGASGVNMIPAGGVALTVLPDADRDGMADSWETNFFGTANTTNNPNNALEDPDGDKMINRDEYVAGTNPTNGLSYLQVELLGFTGGNEAVLQFDAVSNRNYTLDFRNTLDSGIWTNLFSINSATSNRTILLTNTLTSPMRLYRVTIPSE